MKCVEDDGHEYMRPLLWSVSSHVLASCKDMLLAIRITQSSEPGLDQCRASLQSCLVLVTDRALGLCCTKAITALVREHMGYILTMRCNLFHGSCHSGVRLLQQLCLLLSCADRCIIFHLYM